MNRLRKLNNKYEVLITPHLLYQTGLELMLGNWIDKNFDGFKVEKYNDINSATERLCNYPELNFDQLVLYHKEIYNKLYELLVFELENIDEKIVLEHVLKNSKTLRDIFFERVKILGNDFRLLHHMTDIISFNIYVEKEYLVKILTENFIVNQALRIIYIKKNKFDDKKYVKFVGQTDIGTTYQIIVFYS
jgi:hypothetical protein